MESQRQAAANEQQVPVLCDSAGTPRPLAQHHNRAVEAGLSVFRYLAQTIAIIGACLGLFLAIQILSVRSPTDAIGVRSGREVDFKPSNLVKRVADILIARIALLLLAPILILAATLLFILEGYPIFYVSKRFISLDNCVSILKFRTPDGRGRRRDRRPAAPKRATILRANLAAVEDYCSRLVVCACCDKAAWHYGGIRAALEKMGMTIGVNDLQIAGHARSERLMLVGSKVREFELVPARCWNIGCSTAQ